MVGDNRSKRKWLEHAKQVSLAVLGKNRQAVECVLPEIGIKLQAPQRSSQPVAVVPMAVGGQLIAQCVDQASERPAVDSIVGGAAVGWHQQRQAGRLGMGEQLPQSCQGKLPLPNARHCRRCGHE